MDASMPPEWSIRRPKTALQAAWDLAGAPLRMVILPDRASERLHLTSLRAERIAAVLSEMSGHCLDVGAGDNALIAVYRQRAGDAETARASIGVDVVDWAGGATLIKSAEALPFADESFDRVCFVACLNHIPERGAALAEARRVLKPGGQVLLTMIARRLGALGHRIWWYGEDRHRTVAPGEVMGLDRKDMLALLAEAGFEPPRIKRFAYGLNVLYVARRA
jgi:SAM-dependent methyltransferase